MVGKEINQVAEFVSAVVRSLPRDLNPTTAQGWIQNQAALAKALYKALRMAYHLVVDYAQSIQQMIASGRYDWVNSDIEKNFSVKGNGRIELDTELIHFNRFIGSDEVLKELDRLGYRAATAEELLAFGAAYSEKQYEFPIVALGYCTARGRQPACALSLGRQVEAGPGPRLVRLRLGRRLSFPRRAQVALGFWGPCI